GRVGGSVTTAPPAATAATATATATAATAAAGAVGGPDRDVVHDHRLTGGRRAGGAAAERGRELPAHRDVEDDEEPVAGRRGPGTGVHLGGAHGVEVDAVEEPLERLRIAALVPFQGVGVEPALAARRGADPLTADAGLLVADPARAGAAVHRRPLV